MPIGRNIPTLESENYLLRGMTLDDAENLLVFLKDKETMKYITPNPVQSEEEMRINIQAYLVKFAEQKEIPWVIEDKKTGEVIGQYRLHKLNLWHKKVEMGVVLRNDYQNKGVMTEILETVLAYGFETLGLNRIVGDIFAGNQGSRKLLEKYGFNKEGVLKQTDFDGEIYHDTVVYSMLKLEYDKQKVKKGDLDEASKL